MNSEFITNLNNILSEYKTKEKELTEEYASLVSIDNELRKAELKRISEIKFELKDIKEDIAELESDITAYNALGNKINNLNAIISKSKDEGAKYLISKEKEQLSEEYNSLGEALVEKYSKTEEVTNEIPLVDETKESSRKALYTAVAVIAALGIVFGVSHCSKQTKNNVSENNVSITEVDNTWAEEGFVNIEDQETVYERASLIKTTLDNNISNNDYSLEEIENILKWINGGTPNEVGQEEALYAITRIENLMNKENQEEVDNALDYSMFFLDNTQGKELASKIYNSKKELMDTKGTKEFETKAKEFTKLMVNSWVLNGTNNEISSYVLETSGMKALIDTYFLNTYAYIDIPVEVEVMGVKHNLDTVAKSVNEANCKTTVTADNGETFDTYMNKFSSDMIGMVTEATINKQNNNSLKLS